MISESLRSSLLISTADALRAAVLGHAAVQPPPDLSELPFNGVFVTIRVHGELRGCIGFVEVTSPLGPYVAEAAQRACESDSRFPPVAPDEIDALGFDITLLSPREDMSSETDFELGVHGLILEAGEHRGLLLPQVPLEHGWDQEDFLDALCRKAGLSPATRKDERTRLWRFEGTVLTAPLLRQYTAGPTQQHDAGDIV